MKRKQREIRNNRGIKCGERAKTCWSLMGFIRATFSTLYLSLSLIFLLSFIFISLEHLSLEFADGRPGKREREVLTGCRLEDLKLCVLLYQNHAVSCLNSWVCPITKEWQVWFSSNVKRQRWVSALCLKVKWKSKGSCASRFYACDIMWCSQEKGYCETAFKLWIASALVVSCGLFWVSTLF